MRTIVKSDHAYDPVTKKVHTFIAYRMDPPIPNKAAFDLFLDDSFYSTVEAYHDIADTIKSTIQWMGWEHGTSAPTAGVFVNDSGLVRYAEEIVSGKKIIETRSRKMLHDLIGKRVAIIQTGRGKPQIIGSVRIYREEFNDKAWMDRHRSLTRIPKGDEYDSNDKGKWCYFLISPVKYDEPIPLPDKIVRHGRSWCEWKED